MISNPHKSQRKSRTDSRSVDDNSVYERTPRLSDLQPSPISTLIDRTDATTHVTARSSSSTAARPVDLDLDRYVPPGASKDDLHRLGMLAFVRWKLKEDQRVLKEAMRSRVEERDKLDKEIREAQSAIENLEKDEQKNKEELAECDKRLNLALSEQLQSHYDNQDRLTGS